MKNEKMNEKEKMKKNDKMKQTRKMKKNGGKRKKNEEICIHTQNPRRFPGFTVVVVTLVVEILDDFQ